jgi:hypothetical protein
MTTKDFIRLYPEVVVGGKISLYLISDCFNIYNALKKDGDDVTIHLLQLDKLIRDFQYITRTNRQKKLERILKIK